MLEAGGFSQKYHNKTSFLSKYIFCKPRQIYLQTNWPHILQRERTQHVCHRFPTKYILFYLISIYICCVVHDAALPRVNNEIFCKPKQVHDLVCKLNGHKLNKECTQHVCHRFPTKYLCKYIIFYLISIILLHSSQ